MADLMDSDDEDNGNNKAVDTAANSQEEWERSDKIDFGSYLR